MRNDNDDDYTAYEDTAPAAPSDEQILAFVQANIGNPALIAETAAQYGVSVEDLSRATGYDSSAVVSYFQQADVAPPAYEPPPTGGLNAVSVAEEPTPPPPPDERIYEPPRPEIYEPPPDPEEPIYEPPRPPREIVERPEPPRRPDEPPPRPEPPRPEEPPEDLYSTWAQDQVGNPYTKQVVGPRTTYRQNEDGSLTELNDRGDPITANKTYTQTEVNDALTNLLANDPNAKKSDVTALAATMGITADQVNAAYSSLPAAKTTVADTTTNTTTNTTTGATTGTATGTTKTTDTTTAATLPTLTDYQGNQFDGTKLLTLAQQIGDNAGTMTGGAFQTKGENIGFSVEEATKLLGRKPTATEQVLLDMSRQMLIAGVDDLSDLELQDIKSSGVSVQLDPDTNQYYALIPSADGETSTRKELTPDQVAKIKTQEVLTGGEGETSTYRTIDDLVTGKGLFANGKLLTAQDAIDNPIAYTIGSTYTGGGGTNYELKFDPKTGKSVVSANGFTTSDAESIMPIIMIASNFLLPGAGSLLSSTLLEAGMSEFVADIVTKSVLNGVTSGIMAEASGGKFGDGFLKGAVTGAVSAGVAPTISTALPSDLSPAMNTALTKATTAFISATLNGQDGTKALGTSLLGSATSGGLGLVAGETGLSSADAKLLTTTLSPVLNSLILNGNVDNNTLFNTALMAGSTILANTGSSALSNVTTLTTGTDAEKSVGGLNILANETGNETLTDLASTVNTGLGAVSTATGLLNKATALTNTPKTKVNTTRANLTGALRTNTPKTTTTTRTAAVKPAALGALNTTKKTISAQQMSQMKASKPPAQVNVANLTAIKKPPQRVDVKTLIPVKTAQLPAGLNTKKMG
jgi:hypothetical protein